MVGWNHWMDVQFYNKYFYKCIPENLSDFIDSISKLQELNGLIQFEKLLENL